MFPIWLVVVAALVQLPVTSAGLFSGRTAMNAAPGEQDARQQQRHPRPRRQLLEQPSADEWDNDAAMGTVRHVVSEQVQEEKEAAKTCDGQMAKSLVSANDNRMHAQAERDTAVAKLQVAQTRAEEAQAELTLARRVLGDKIAKMEQDMQMSGNDAAMQMTQARNEAAQQVLESQTNAQQEIAAIQASHTQALLDKETFWNESIQKAEETNAVRKAMEEQNMVARQAEHEQAMQDKEAIIAEWNEKWEQHGVVFKADANQKIAAAEQDRDATVTEISERLSAQEKQAAQALQDATEKVESHFSASLTAVEQERDELQRQVEDAARKFGLEIEKIKSSYKLLNSAQKGTLGKLEKATAVRDYIYLFAAKNVHTHVLIWMYATRLACKNSSYFVCVFCFSLCRIWNITKISLTSDPIAT
jgi:hypothetical protein